LELDVWNRDANQALPGQRPTFRAPKIIAEKPPFARREHGGSFRVAVDYHERSDGERDMNGLEKLKNNEIERLMAGRYWVVRDPVEAGEPTYRTPLIANED